MQSTPYFPLGCVTTSRNSGPFKRRVRAAASIHWIDGPLSPCQAKNMTHSAPRPTTVSRMMKSRISFSIPILFAVILFGLLSSMILNMIITPGLYLRFGRPARSIEENER